MAENDWSSDALPGFHATGDGQPIAPEFNKVTNALATIRSALSKPTGLGNQLIAATDAATARSALGAMNAADAATFVPTTTRARQGGIATLNGLGRVPHRQDTTGCQTGFFYNSSVLNDPNNDITTTSIAALEADLSVTADFVLIFGGVTPGGSFSAAAWSKITAFLDAGRKVVFNFALTGTLANINAGQFDTALNQLGAYIVAYAAAHPTWADKLIVKVMHEVNASIVYPWCVFTSQNLADNGGSVVASQAAAVTAFRRASTTLRTAATRNGESLALMVFECGSVHDTSTAVNGFLPFDGFYPGDAYVDIVSVTVYNRFGLSSGNNVWTSFEAQATPALDAFRRIAPGKPIMIGEVSSNDGGQILSVSVPAGGSGYAAGTTVTAGGPGSGAVLTPTITGGAITAVTVNQRGRDYNDAIFFQTGATGGGTGATFTGGLIGEKFSKADWLYDAQVWLKSQTDVKYMTWFFTNIGTGGDQRMWALNTALEKARWREGHGVLTGRVRGGNGVTPRGRIGVNLADDPYCNDVSRWTASGSNVGTLTRTSAPQNHSGYDAAVSDNTGAIRLMHNGTAAADPTTNMISAIVAAGLVAQNENFTLSFDARFKPTGPTASVLAGTPLLTVGLQTNDANAFLRKLQPPITLSSQWRRYTVSTYMTVGSAGAKLAFAIGAASQAGQLLISNVKLEYGPDATPMLPAQRTITRTTVQDAAYTFVGGSTDELLAYTTLTAARTVTLPDASTVPRGRVITVKDEAGTAGTNTLTVATTASQTIDGASTKTISAAYGLLRLYSSGAAWFTC